MVHALASPMPATSRYTSATLLPLMDFLYGQSQKAAEIGFTNVLGTKRTLFRQGIQASLNRYDSCELDDYDHSFSRAPQNLPYAEFSFFTCTNRPDLNRDYAKDSYFAPDGIPRTILISAYEPQGYGMPLSGALLSISISLRGEGVCTATHIFSGRLTDNYSFRLTESDLAHIIPREQEDLRRVVYLSGGREEIDFHYHFDITDQAGTLLESTSRPWQQQLTATASNFNTLFPSRILVPADYPYSIPLELVPGCLKQPRCAMCSLEDTKKSVPTLSSVKSHIDEWAGRLGLAACRNPIGFSWEE